MGGVTLGEATADVVERLRDKGVKRQVVLMRHSARHYSTDSRLEPFMGLTESGKEAAMALGRAFGDSVPVTPCSSYIGRCIETAYLMQRGSGCQTGKINTLEAVLSPFYVKAVDEVIGLFLELGLSVFIRHWIDGVFPERIISPALDAAARMLQFARAHLDTVGAGLTVGVTHDWNIFALKEAALQLPHEIWGEVAYLEGVVLFYEAGRLMAVNHQREPVAVDDGLWTPKGADLVYG